MSDRWLKPDFQEICVAGECTAYAGTQDAGDKFALGLPGLKTNHRITENTEKDTEKTKTGQQR